SGTHLAFNMNVIRNAPQSMIDFYADHPERIPYTTTGDSRLMTPEMRTQLAELGKLDPQSLYNPEPDAFRSPEELGARWEGMKADVLGHEIEAITMHEMGHVASMHAMIEANGPAIVTATRGMASDLLSSAHLKDLYDFNNPPIGDPAEREGRLQQRFA